MVTLRGLAVGVALMFLASGAPAATLNVVGGQLFGASGVNVGGNLYEVSFVDGSCTNLFTGCDGPGDFTFNTQAGAIAASQALLDQVLIGIYDSDPYLTFGCTDSGVAGTEHCHVLTPYAREFYEDFFADPPIFYPIVASWGAYNVIPETGDRTLSYIGGNPDWNLGPQIDQVYALWTFTSVPEPATALLMVLGLLVMGARGLQLRSIHSF